MKKAIRSKIINQRKQFSKDKAKLFSSQICKRIIKHEIFINSNPIALYHPFANEVDLSLLLKSDKQLLLPLIKENQNMVFQSYKKGDKLIPNKYGILEPIESTIIKPNEINLCLVPLVGFNRLGDRLGMGAGYYDRYFANNNSQKKPTILVGVAYDFQENATIKSDTWDIPLNYIFTNKEVIKI